MEWLPIVIALFVGFVMGLIAALALRVIQAKTARELANELFRESEAERKANIDSVISNLKDSFGNISLDALAKSREDFLALAKAKLDSEREVSIKELEGKKGLIDQQLQHMTLKLEDVSKMVKELEKDRVQKFGELATQLKTASEQTAALTQTTSKLQEVLASTKARGQWGERMAEDILRCAGFIENVNYFKQKTIESAGSRPDFTFALPRDRRLNMDVKFPLDNYVKFCSAESEPEKVKCRSDFLRDVRARFKEVTTREYINSDTVDYVLLLIPSEQIYAFIHQEDSSIIDEGIKNKVVCCSPITLFAVLAVIRQAVDNFTFEQTSNEILSLLGRFKKQWDEFVKKLDQLGKRINQAHEEYEALSTTRRRQLEKPLTEIDNLRKERGLLLAETPGEETASADSLDGERSA